MWEGEEGDVLQESTTGHQDDIINLEQRVSLYSYEDYIHEFLDEKSEDELYNEDSRIEADSQVLEGGEYEVGNMLRKPTLSIRFHLPKEDKRTIDLNCLEDTMYLYSHQYKSRVFLPAQVSKKKPKLEWDENSSALRVTLDVATNSAVLNF
ncbi:uncharacterized protein LOC111718339 [Eurytemora carolleeae]|uniref:uncharacterized protein LOC111718339 n=1 Tax=Eurytemora carolleeae TaxID=1294199 RepID=UPI000C7618E5|nr:uncharacterized protein LOC111718339 [Eurytemora carolleeae]|eukprot:XP_023349672.1 uncharacterized protein LOC111718339 [Eurytemora affinis]